MSEWAEAQKREMAEFGEMYRRIHNVIDEHPGLSGMMTDEILDYLPVMMRKVGAGTWIPTDLKPSWDLELHEVVERRTQEDDDGLRSE